MASWAEFEDAVPELAEEGQRLFYQFGVGLGFLATIREDGGPRLHPVCPVIVAGGLYVFVVPSPKRADLHEVGRMNDDPVPASALRGFRERFHGCLRRRADALFEVADAVLTAGRVPSPPHLSFGAMYRRGWGSLYAALCKGRIDENAVRDLLARHPMLQEDRDRTSVYAVDVTFWPRCDAESSPERGYYYHPSRHSAGQPIVAGLAYQLIAEIGFARDT